MSDVTLSASVRQSLLSLQGTTNLIERTQGRLSTGLRVASAIDDPVSFFSAKSLSDRAGDLLEKKDGIDQGISTVTGALDGVEGIEALVRQMKGIANSMKSATASQVSDLVSQFNDLRAQINNLATDATYQGTNLINGTGQTLQIEFSEQTASLLNVSSVDLRAGTAGLSVTSQAAFTSATFPVSHGEINAASAGSGNLAGYLSTGTFTLTFAGPTTTYTAGQTVSFSYGTGSDTFSLVAGTGSDLTVTNGQALTVEVVTATDQLSTGNEFALATNGNRNLVFSIGGTTAATTATSTGGDTLSLTYAGSRTITLTTADGPVAFEYGTADLLFRVGSGQSVVLSSTGTVLANVQFYDSNTAGAFTGTTTAAQYFTEANGAASIAAVTAGDTGTARQGVAIASFSTAIEAQTDSARYVRAGDTATLNAAISELDTALTTLRTQASSLGSNVALLNTRLDFTEQYVNTLQGGADKLTLADINEEGANLLALQTRQQLGIQSLSLAAQAEASILQLFG